MVGLAECGTHALTAAALGVCTAEEMTLARDLIGSLGPGMLVLAGRGFYSLDLWNQARGTGADLLWRAKARLVLRPHEELADASWLARLRERPGRSHGMCDTNVMMRVIDYGISGPGRPQAGDQYRLITHHRRAARAGERRGYQVRCSEAGRWAILKRGSLKLYGQ